MDLGEAAPSDLIKRDSDKIEDYALNSTPVIKTREVSLRGFHYVTYM